MKAIILHGGGGEVVTSKDWIEDRDTVIQGAQLIGKITSNSLLEVATAAVKEMKVMLRSLEATREEVKAPVLAKGREVDETAKSLGNPILAQIAATEREIGVYSREQQRLRDEQARQLREAQEAEERRIRAEQEAERRRIEAEKERQYAEAEAKRKAELLEAQSAADARRIQAEAQYAKEVADRKAADAAKASEAAAAIAANETRDLFVAPAALKVPIKMVARCEVTDVIEVLASFPKLIRWELDKAELNRMVAKGVRDIPGCRVWEEQEVRIR